MQITEITTCKYEVISLQSNYVKIQNLISSYFHNYLPGNSLEYYESSNVRNSIKCFQSDRQCHHNILISRIKIVYVNGTIIVLTFLERPIEFSLFKWTLFDLSVFHLIIKFSYICLQYFA